MAKTIGVTRRLPPEGLDLLRASGATVILNEEDRPLSPEELRALAARCDGLIVQLVDRVDAALLDAGKNLKVVANYAVGVDNIDRAAAAARGVVVTNTPDVLTRATAELAWALLLGAARRVAEGDRLTREGGFRGWAPLLHLGVGVSGKTLGIVGAGRIGAAVARIGAGFGMTVLYHARSAHPEIEREARAVRVDLPRLLAESDFVSLHVPLTAETRHLIGEKELSSMKPTAVLVNTARGPVVDEEALVRALKQKKIFAAGLDVFEREPQLAAGLAELPNVLLAPHAGSATFETRAEMSVLAAKNVLAVLEGRPALTPVRT